MLANVKEEGRTKCDQYWPQSTETPLVYNSFKISLQSEHILIENSLIQRNLLIEDKECNTHSVIQIHMTNWGDHSIPDEESGYFTLEEITNKINKNKSISQSPVVIHCR